MSDQQALYVMEFPMAGKRPRLCRALAFPMQMRQRHVV
jgi:hypothetical protein